jgi:hypothetical protein
MAKLGIEAAIEANDKAVKKALKLDYFKVESTPKTIRFITEDDMSKNIMTYYEHFVRFKNTWTRYFSCPDDTPGSSTCVICKFKTGANGDILENSYGTKFIMQVIERDSKDKEGNVADRVKVFKFSPFLMGTLKAYIDTYGDLGDRDYHISLLNETKDGKKKIAYIVEPATKKAVPTSDEDDILIADRVDLLDTEPIYDESEILKLAALTAITKQGPATDEMTSIKDTLTEFLSTKDENDDILGNLPKVTDTVTIELPVDDDDEEDKDFFRKTLKKYKST